MAEKKKTTKKVAKKTTKKVAKKTTKKDLTIDRETELEERRAYLEEARSQEASSD